LNQINSYSLKGANISQSTHWKELNKYYKNIIHPITPSTHG